MDTAIPFRVIAGIGYHIIDGGAGVKADTSVKPVPVAPASSKIAMVPVPVIDEMNTPTKFAGFFEMFWTPIVLFR